MNYFVHYHFYKGEDNPWYVLGLLLPDLVSNFNRNAKIKEELRAVGIEGFQSLPYLNAGINNHFEADRIFHSSQFFFEGQECVKDAFAKENLWLPGIRSFFVTHIMIELMLDRYLLLTFPDEGIEVYEQLGKIDGMLVENILVGNGLEVAGFHNFFSRFVSARYVLSYTRDESLFYALCRILERTIGITYNENHFSGFQKAVEELDGFVIENIERLNNFI